MKKLNPNRKVGLVTFNNDVVMIGDGMADPIFIAGDRLNKFDVDYLSLLAILGNLRIGREERIEINDDSGL